MKYCYPLAGSFHPPHANASGHQGAIPSTTEVSNSGLTETVTGPDPGPGAWIAAIDGGTGEVALLPASRGALSSARG